MEANLRVLLLLLIAPLVACGPELDTAVDDRLTFGFPLPQRHRVVEPPFVGVDHDPVDHGDSLRGRVTCTAHNGQPYPHCYDGHSGTDFILIGSFEAMDAEDMPIVAAADGVVVGTEDGHYDRCHLEGTDVSCDGHEMRANHVIIEHDGGMRTKYWHLRTDSVAVQVGDEVVCGTYLGLVGSSGRSSLPHLHFGVETAEEVLVDPFSGPESQPDSWWSIQVGEDGLPGAGCALP